jgi:hypothetical protein
MNSFCLNVPFNATSLGSVSFAITREIYKRGLSPCIFPIGNGVDLNAQTPDNDFFMWLQSCVNKSIKYHKRNNISFKLWHLNNSLDSFSKKQALYFFHETTDPTEAEINAINNQEVSFTSSKFTADTFTEYDAKNVIYAPLGFDNYHFKKITNKDYLGNDVIVFGLQGKMESRKNTLRIIKLWAQKYGNNPKFRLDCLVFNPFLPPEQQEQMLIQALEGKRYFNIKFFPWLQKNTEVNDFLNHLDIDLTGLSGMEGFNLPAFNTLCLGKQGVFLNAHVHKDYANSENAILVQPTKQRQAVDGVFFGQGQPFNQGSWFDAEDEAFIAGMEAAVLKAKQPNPAGEKLKDIFTYSRLTDTILENIQKL